jgi:hypothetical protein
MNRFATALSAYVSLISLSSIANIIEQFQAPGPTRASRPTYAIRLE